MREQDITDSVLSHYEGLVRSTASRYIGMVEGHDIDDLRQVFRIKVWRALLSFDPSKSKLSRDRYVFSCLANQVKDLLRKKRKYELYIEDIAPTPGSSDRRKVHSTGNRDRFELRYMGVSEEDIFGDVLKEAPLLPNTLTKTERALVALSYEGFDHTEMSERLGITKREVAAGLKSVREKLADWKPTAPPLDSLGAQLVDVPFDLPDGRTVIAK